MEGVVWKGLDGVGRRTRSNSKSVVVRSGQLEQRDQFSALLPRQRGWLGGAFDFVLIQVHQDKVILGELGPFVPSLNPDYVRARCFEGLDQSSREHRDEDTSPHKWVEQVDNGLTDKMEHGGMRRQQNNAGFCQSILEENDNIRNREGAEQGVQICVTRSREFVRSLFPRK